MLAGGHLVGKGVCEEFCACGSSYTASTGPVMNPLDTSKTSGGSTSGVGVLVRVNIAQVSDVL